MQMRLAPNSHSTLQSAFSHSHNNKVTFPTKERNTTTDDHVYRRKKGGNTPNSRATREQGENVHDVVKTESDPKAYRVK